MQAAVDGDDLSRGLAEAPAHEEEVGLAEKKHLPDSIKPGRAKRW